MNHGQIPRDDLIDVIEMTSKLEKYISNVLKDNEKTLAMSALMSASVNCMLAQCKTFEEVMFYRNFFSQILDGTIRSIEIKKQPKPPPPSSSFS